MWLWQDSAALLNAFLASENNFFIGQVFTKNNRKSPHVLRLGALIDIGNFFHIYLQLPYPLQVGPSSQNYDFLPPKMRNDQKF